MVPVRSAIIVGAGSAGWLAALSLQTYCPWLKLSLIRPRNTSPIGVGESTQLDFMELLRAARIDIGEFYNSCDATMKCGIHYRDWNRVGEDYWHPFSNLVFSGSYTPAHYYQQMILRSPGQYSHEKYYSSVHSSYDTCVNRNLVAPESAAAFHVDASKITAYLERILTGVEVIETDDVDVLSEAGRVSGVRVNGDTRLEAELYVDCTGFSRALHKHVATPEVIPYTANVNSVVAAQIPFADREQETTPFTRAHAHVHGWTWSIPLKTRIGTGYVYHGDFCTPDEAEHNFRQYWGAERLADINVRHIAFDSTCLKNPWVSNVVAIGLSAGFVEPLEATGLNWIITSANTLAQSLSEHYFDEDVSRKYNCNVLGYIYDVLDFIDAHYVLSARRDSPFWQWQTSRDVPERLRQRLHLYSEEMPSDANRLKTSPWAFNEISWLDILNGYRFSYRPLQINDRQQAQAAGQLQEIQGATWQGVPPLEWQPVMPR